MGQHAKLSPSASYTWMTCPGSILLADRLQLKSTESVYASMGTAMHSVSETCLRRGIKNASEFIGRKVEGVEITADMAETCQTFIDYVNSIDTGDAGFVAYEQRVKIPYVGNCWGTADVIKVVCRPGWTILHVIDLKTGAGVPVDANENTQGLCYGAGAFDMLSPIYDFDEIIFTVVQPPLNSISSFAFDVDRLERFKQELIEAEERIITHKPLVDKLNLDAFDSFELWAGVFNASDKACKFCAAKLYCPAQRKMVQDAARADFSDSRTDDLTKYLTMWMNKVPLLKEFIKAVEGTVEKKLLAGQRVSGFKLVEGRKTRVWADEKALADALEERFDDEIYTTKPELLSVAQMEKALKGLDFNLTPYITKTPGSPTVVPEDDPRPPLNPSNSAKDDFKDL